VGYGHNTAISWPKNWFVYVMDSIYPFDLWNVQNPTRLQSDFESNELNARVSKYLTSESFGISTWRWIWIGTCFSKKSTFLKLVPWLVFGLETLTLCEGHHLKHFILHNPHPKMPGSWWKVVVRNAKFHF